MSSKKPQKKSTHKEMIDSEILDKTLKENECQELPPSKTGKPVVVCKRRGKLEYYELSPLGSD
jgi:hypothetical protein